MSLEVWRRYEATCRGYDEAYRAEQMEKYFAAVKRVKPEGVVLDAGCGTGLFIEFLAATGLLSRVEKLVCLDYSPCMASIAAWRASKLCPGKCIVGVANVEHLPLADKTVDVTYSFTVLDLVENLEVAVGELLRVTRGPVVVSMMKRLPYKDSLLQRSRIVAVTRVDVIMEILGEGTFNAY